MKVIDFNHALSDLQASHDALFLKGGPVTWPEERRHVEGARPILEAWLESHGPDTAEADGVTVKFLHYSLNLLYSTAFLSRHDQDFADRLIDYTSRTLDHLHTTSPNDPHLAALFALEAELFQEA